jgi:hypothetical protein
MFSASGAMYVNFHIQNELLNEAINELPRDHGTVPKINNFYEKTIPLYSLNDFRYFFRLTPSGFEVLLTTMANAGQCKLNPRTTKGEQKWPTKLCRFITFQRPNRNLKKCGIIFLM